MNSLFDCSAHIRKFRDNAFLRASNSEISYGSFFNSVQNTANALRDSGVKNGDIIIINDVSLFDYPGIFFSIWKIGAIAFPVNPKLPDEQLTGIIRESGARHIIVTQTSEKIHDINLIFINRITGRTDINSDPSCTLDLNQPATLFMTSGSSAKAKYALHNLNNHFFNARGVNAFFNLKKNDNWLLSLPLYHVGGIAILFRTLLAGASFSIPSSNKSLSDNLLEFQPSRISLVFTQLQRLLTEEKAIQTLQNCTSVFLGGSAIPQSVLKKAQNYNLNIFSGYGLTEMASSVAIRDHKKDNQMQAEILKFREVKIENGEICLKGPCLFLGYLENSELSMPFKEGWFYTKDHGTKTDSKMTVLGRMDNMFISGGENIQPEEIENVLLSLEGIEQAIVVPVPDAEYGQRPAAFLQYSDNLHLTYSEILQFLSGKLPSYKIPDLFLDWPEDLPQGYKSGIKLSRKWFLEQAAKIKN